MFERSCERLRYSLTRLLSKRLNGAFEVWKRYVRAREAFEKDQASAMKKVVRFFRQRSFGKAWNKWMDVVRWEKGMEEQQGRAALLLRETANTMLRSTLQGSFEVWKEKCRLMAQAEEEKRQQLKLQTVGNGTAAMG